MQQGRWFTYFQNKARHRVYLRFLAPAPRPVVVAGVEARDVAEAASSAFRLLCERSSVYHKPVIAL